MAMLCTSANAAEVLVVFTLQHCPPCVQFHRDVQAVPGLVGGRPMVTVDVAADPRMARRFGVRGTPTFVVCDGEPTPAHEVRRLSGYSGPGPFKEWVEGKR